VKVVDGRTYRITDDSKVGGMPTDVVVGPHGDLYIADHVGRTIFRLRRRGLAPSVLR